MMSIHRQIRQDRAIEAMLTTRTIAQAAQVAQISDRTLYRWLQQPEFKARLEQAQQQRLREKFPIPALGFFETAKRAIRVVFARNGRPPLLSVAKRRNS